MGVQAQLILIVVMPIFQTQQVKALIYLLLPMMGQLQGVSMGQQRLLLALKAVMNKSSNGNRCVVEFERLNNALKITE